jgi:putative chitinase
LANTYTKFTTDSIEASTNPNLYWANDYLQNSSGVANVAMCCKYGNGNVASGDGYKYRGRGLLQLTFKGNYSDFKTWYNNKYDPDIDPVTTPSLLKTNDTLAILSGMWFYKKYVLDAITVDSTTTVKKVTKRINSGNKGIDDRKARFKKAKDSINCITN